MIQEGSSRGLFPTSWLLEWTEENRGTLHYLTVCELWTYEIWSGIDHCNIRVDLANIFVVPAMGTPAVTLASNASDSVIACGRSCIIFICTYSDWHGNF